MFNKFQESWAFWLSGRDKLESRTYNSVNFSANRNGKCLGSQPKGSEVLAAGLQILGCSLFPSHERKYSTSKNKVPTEPPPALPENPRRGPISPERHGVCTSRIRSAERVPLTAARPGVQMLCVHGLPRGQVRGKPSGWPDAHSAFT